MPPAQKIPQALAEKFASIIALSDAFCSKHLNDEYRGLIHRVIGSLARKRPSPLLKGKENVWAAAAIIAMGRTNFLDDPSQVPHCPTKTIYEWFGIAQSTASSRAKEIEDVLQMGPFSPTWTVPSRLADNPMVWMLQINGIVIDIRDAPKELQQLAYDKGMIPFIPTQVDS